MAKLNFEQEAPVPVEYDKLPPEFRKADKPFGLEMHQFFRIWFAIGHVSAFYAIFFVIGRNSIYAFLYGVFLAYLTGLGTTVGSHRYWTHKTFKANKALQILLMLLQTAGIQMPIFKWCRDHRVHHKYTDTDADPHSSAKGFWFCHIIWKLFPYHPDAKKALRIVDISDLARDPIVRFQSKYYFQLVFVFAIVLPIAIGKYLFPELSLMDAWTANMLRVMGSLHGTFLVNSAAHMWGDRPYDKYISSTDSKLVSLIAIGEGWHNYHHTFPWDYAAAEFGFYYNFSTVFIHFFAWIGWAWDLKMVNQKMLVDRINRTGDGKHPLFDKNKKEQLGKTEDDFNKSLSWGWGDKSICKDDIKITETVNVKIFNKVN